MCSIQRFLRGVTVCSVMLTPLLTAPASGSVVIRREIAPKVFAQLDNGRDIVLHCYPPAGKAAEPFLRKLLANENDWRAYASAQSVAVPFLKLKPEVRRDALLAVFEEDYVDEQGWTHFTLPHPEPYAESLWTLCEWITGNAYNYKEVMAANGMSSQTLAPGQRIFIPVKLLPPVMRTLTPDRIPAEERNGGDVADLEALAAMLTYRPAQDPKYAVYKLRAGEALYTSVVVRFTALDLAEQAHATILAASAEIAKVSGIKDVTNIKIGQEILIPIDMLQDRFKPKGTEARQEFEESLRTAERLRGQVKSKDLAGVVVVLDAGHGGRDHGASNPKFGLYEDEINYDICSRIKRKLEAETQAKVRMTMLDPDQSYTPTDARRFAHDTDEIVLSEPRYPNEDAQFSANLRYLLANQMYREEVKLGADPMKIIFTSIHTDSLGSGAVRGAMVYIPGARYRKDVEQRPVNPYGRYVRDKSELTVRTTEAERRRDEALSRNFAATLLRTLGEHRIKRHSQGDPIRAQIVRDGRTVFVPAILRGNIIPTKVLVETANLRSDVDCARLADPAWRQLFADAYVAALKAHFDS